MVDDSCLLAEFKSLREEILDRSKLRTQYELLAYSVFMSLIGISVYVGYSAIILMFVQLLLLPSILMITQLMHGVMRLGTYLAAKAEVNKAVTKLPWEYLAFKREEQASKKPKKKRIMNFSAHIWVLVTPVLISFVYFSSLIVLSNSFVNFMGEKVTWDLTLINSNIYIKLAVLCLTTVLFSANIYACYKYAKIDDERVDYFEIYKKELTELQNPSSKP
jgi:hypothetical protein